VARGEDQDEPSRGGAEGGSDETQDDGAEWLLRQLGAGGPGDGGATPSSPAATSAAAEPGDVREPGPSRPSTEPHAPRKPASPATATPVIGTASRAEGDQRRKVVLLLIALVVAAVLALTSLFLLGMRLGAGSAARETPSPAPSEPAAPSETPTPTPTATPTEAPSPAAAGPVAPGTHPWDELRGGECLDPYGSPWEEEYTVVDCAQPHPAQLAYRGRFPADTPAYPGEQAIQPQLSLLCSAPTVIDLTAASSFADLQVQGAYPATAEQWDAGQRDIFCFVSRSTGEPLTGSIAVP
jgi:hypothetical protein